MTMTDYFQQEKEQLGKDYEKEGGINHKYYIYVKSQHFLKRIGGFFPDSSKLNCLTIGCGIGEAEEHFAGHFKKVVGIDYSKPMIQKAKSKEIPNACFKRMDASNMKFKDASFDIVVAFNMFHHIPSGIIFKNILKEIQRVLKNNGLFFNYDMNPLNPATRKMIKSLTIDKDVHLGGFSKNKFPTTFFASEFTHLAEQHCFKKIRKETLIFFPRQLRLLSFLEPLFNKTPFGGLYCLVFKKA